MAGGQTDLVTLIPSSKGGAGDGLRTRYLDLGKVALYQVSYSRSARGKIIPRPIGPAGQAVVRSASKISSIRRLNVRASENASGSEGSYLPVSIALTVCRDTPSFSARSACDHASSARRTRS